jgi:hypothetical protein
MIAYTIVRAILKFGIVAAVLVMWVATVLLGSKGHKVHNLTVSDSFKPQLNVYIA